MPAHDRCARRPDPSRSRGAPLSPTHSERLATLFRLRKVAAREHLLLPGATDHEVLFVARGLLRFYYPGADGREANKAFVAEGQFAGAVGAAQIGGGLLYGVQALEDASVLSAPYAAFLALMDAEPAFERLGRKLAEYLLARKERRARQMLLLNASERYQAFACEHPSLMQRVPLYHIASLIGVTDVHLSRIRRGLAGHGAGVLNAG